VSGSAVENVASSANCGDIVGVILFSLPLFDMTDCEESIFFTRPLRDGIYRLGPLPAAEQVVMSTSLRMEFHVAISVVALRKFSVHADVHSTD